MVRAGQSWDRVKPARAGAWWGAGGPGAQEKQKAGQPSTCVHGRGILASAWPSGLARAVARPTLTQSLSVPSGPDKGQTGAFQSRGCQGYRGQWQVTRVLGVRHKTSWKRCLGGSNRPQSSSCPMPLLRFESSVILSPDVGAVRWN